MGMKRVAINGFGRIGRLALRALFEYENDGLFEIVATNSRTTAEQRAYLFKYDSVHRRFSGDVSVKGESLLINGKTVKVLAEAEVEDLPWKDMGIDLVIESSGKYTDASKAAKHLEAGARKVLITAPAKNEDATIVMGVNEGIYDPSRHHVVSNASCTTNCLAPVVKVIHEAFVIEKGLMTTTHAYTNDQKTLDASHKNLHRGRAAALSMIPTTTGAASAIGKVYPEVAGKMNGLAVRVPTPDVSLVDLVTVLSREVTSEEVNGALLKAAEGPMKRYLAYEEDDIVSVDVTGDSRSSVFAARHTMTLGNLVKTLSWYDNEWGYACRVVDLANYMLSREA
ncbi:MAG: type I glyceraldehyde-3-phosphate dehydrogenase [Thermovirgaceae bacterium]|jgi:glyceraldehyde 3-phosphate dehydrogenase|nr:type I glyceraldehyde-3-phosphate dehydrogenase [Synergistales bacterium]MDI9392007.1 type I glyceraldehyde-3-phosphate dehydrogenase [Synergistota bacterium]HRW88050.1 type I glyceraldehyde-3-phosphate dehydrogenase [Thermovirgaceae bacterium]MDD3133293.1 type I glyceraldehyde-3-phosphate dehydrogenase [Synergistales bacterium]MDD3829422.1 type I glyceraldehyde-3-phosphate dehydrogenase [Synergistales bacterium]